LLQNAANSDKDFKHFLLFIDREVMCLMNAIPPEIR
jgi:hypothetical protein